MITVSDFFAGAGGSSTGATQVPGVLVRVAANHWQTAVDIHNANHPNTDHAVVDLHKERPSYFPYTDVGWFSPECTKWSQASGTQMPAIEEGLFEDPLSDEVKTRSRLLMFDVLKFVGYHRYRLVIVENVVDIATQSQYRTAWTVWRQELRALGYEFRVVSLNSMHAQLLGAPAPQSRDRIYIVAWPYGAKAPDLDKALRPRAYCPRCNIVSESVQSFKPGRTVGRYKQAYLYCCPRCGTQVEPGWLPAMDAIDWSIPGERVGDRLKPKTRARIAAGIARYWGPIHLEAQGNQYDAADPKHRNYGDPDAYYRAWPVEEPLKALHTSNSKALAVPVEGRDGKEARPTDLPLRTMTTRAETALVVNHVSGADDSRSRPTSQCLPTLVAGGQHASLVEQPFIAEMYGTSTARPVTEPAGTFTSGGNHHALVQSYYGNTTEARPVTDPVGTLTTVDRYALIHRNNSGGAEMTTPVTEELRTLTTAGHQALLQAGTPTGRPKVSPADLKAAEEMVPDVLFRMFQPHEVAAGMAFPKTYNWQPPNRNRPVSNRDLVKAAGNAVTPPSARDLIGVCVESITGEEVAA